MYATDYFEIKMLRLLKNEPLNAPKSQGVFGVYLGMLMSSPGDTGEEGYEVNYSGYNRQKITFSLPYEVDGGLAIENVDQINFAESPIDVGMVTHVAVWDSPGGGNVLLYGELDTSLNVLKGVTPIFRAGSVKWIWTGNLGNYYRDKIMRTFCGEDCLGIIPYIGFCNGDPQQNGVEFSGYGYKRIKLDISDPQEQSNGSTMCYNKYEIISEPAIGTWGTLSYVCIYDSESDGHEFAVIPLQTGFPVTAQTSVGFHIGSLRFSVN